MQLEDIPALRSYLASKLASLSDADPAALADYIIALLKHEKPLAELKVFCISQLVDFLHDHTNTFVDRLFVRIETGKDVEERPVEPVRNTMDDIVMAPSSNTVAAQFPTSVVRREQPRDQSSFLEHSRSYSDDEEGERHYRPRRGDSERYANRSRSPPSFRHQNSNNFQSVQSYGRSTRGYPPRTSGSRGLVSRYAARGGRTGTIGNAPAHQRSDTRLVIDRIPAEFCTISAVNDYFQKFGSVVNITMQPEFQRARIEYATRDQANAAYTSPDVIFGNRFVKVFWDHDDPTTTPTGPGMVPRRQSQSSTIPSETSFTRMDTAAIKKQEALRGMLELQKQKQELLLKYIAQQKEILQTLESKTLPEAERQEMLTTLRGIDELIKTLNVSGLSESPDKKTVAQGTHSSNASAVSTGSAGAVQPHQPILRGGPVSRGRGGAFANRAAHRLDLRPTSLLLHPIPARVGQDVGAIKKLFESYGEIKNVSITAANPAGAIVSFAKRLDAEKALQYISKTDLGETFQLEWHSASSPTGTTVSAAQSAAGLNDHIAFDEDPMTE